MPFTFQNRPPVAVEPLTLGSGDIEAVEYPPRIPGFPPPPMALHANPPAARPRQPTRPPMPTRAPSPSPSLAPVSMNAVRGRADSTVPPPRASEAEIVVRTRPSLKMGFSILMAGAIVGSILGITTTPKHAAAAYQPAVEATGAAHAEPKDEPPVAKNEKAEPKDKEAPKETADAKDDDAKDKVAAGAKKKKTGGPIARVAGPTPPPKTPLARGAEKPEKPGKDDSDDGYRVASADPNAEREPAKGPKAAKKKAAKDDDDDETPAAPPPKKKPKASDDAMNVLKAAMGATENTL